MMWRLIGAVAPVAERAELLGGISSATAWPDQPATPGLGSDGNWPQSPPPISAVGSAMVKLGNIW